MKENNREEIFSERYRTHKDMVFRIAMTYLKNPADAGDVLQDVFLKLYTHEKPFESEEHMKRWLIRVTINLAKNRLTAFWNSHRQDVEIPESFGMTDMESEVLSAVLGLPPRYKAVIYLHYMEGYAYQEIAQILHIRLSAVKMRAKRGREYLKADFLGEGKGVYDVE